MCVTHLKDYYWRQCTMPNTLLWHHISDIRLESPANQPTVCWTTYLGSLKLLRQSYYVLQVLCEGTHNRLRLGKVYACHDGIMIFCSNLDTLPQNLICSYDDKKTLITVCWTSNLICTWFCWCLIFCGYKLFVISCDSLQILQKAVSLVPENL